MDAIDKDIICEFLQDNIKSRIHLDVHKSLESTNSHLMLSEKQSEFDVCISDVQTRGRGRHGKVWHSPAGSNIYMSLSHLTQKPFSELSGFSLIIGISVAETLQKYCNKKVQTKWPNDLLVENKKLCGILIELQSSSDKSTKVVTGLGINVAMEDKDFRQITQPVTDLESCNPVSQLSRNQVIADLLTQLCTDIEFFNQKGFTFFHDRWNKIDAWYNQEVRLHLNKETLTGLHKGVDDSGALLLEINGELNRWTSGEISLRRVN